MKCLITGAGGFIGGHLARFLVNQGQSVTAMVHRPGPVPASIGDGIASIAGDILEENRMGEVIRETKPDYIFHLAAQSLPRVSWEQPALTCRVNVIGTVNLLESVAKSGMNPIVVAACSSSEYAASPTPIAETADLVPSSIYGVTKLAQDHVVRLYERARKVRAIRVRPFFLIGPGKRGDVCSDLARGIVRIESGETRELPVGRLDVVRDFLDIADGVRAFWQVAKAGVCGEVYNICSGRGWCLRDVLALLKGMAKAPVAERFDSERARVIDEPVKVGDPGRLLGLGWKPTVPIERSLGDILEYWRSVRE